MIQSILFNKDQWTRRQANKWLKEHNYIVKYPGKSGAHETKNQLRYRQLIPIKGANYSIKTLPDEGIEYVLMYID